MIHCVVQVAEANADTTANAYGQTNGSSSVIRFARAPFGWHDIGTDISHAQGSGEVVPIEDNAELMLHYYEEIIDAKSPDPLDELPG